MARVLEYDLILIILKQITPCFGISETGGLIFIVFVDFLRQKHDITFSFYRMNVILFKLITSAPNGFDTVGVFVNFFNFVTQAVDMHR